MAAVLKNEESSGVVATLCEVVLGALAGVLVCAVWLVCKPVSTVDAAPDPQREITDRHEVFHVRGSSGNLRSTVWARKEKAFLDQTPGVVQFTEAEINRWISARFASIDRSKTNEDFDAEMQPGLPMVNLEGDEMTIAMEINFKVAGMEKNFVVQAHGAFEKQGEVHAFVPAKVHVGSCPLSWSLGGRQVFGALVSKFPVSDEVRNSWTAVNTVALTEGRLQLVFGDGEITRTPAPAAVSPAEVPAPAALAPAETTPAPMAEVVAPPATVADAPEAVAPTSSESAVVAPAGTEPSPASTLDAGSPAATPIETPPESAVTDATAVPVNPPATEESPAPAPEESPAAEQPSLPPDAPVQEETAPAAPAADTAVAAPVSDAPADGQ